MFDSVVKCFLHYPSAKRAESKAKTRGADLSSVHSQSDDSMGVFQLFQLLGAVNLMDGNGAGSGRVERLRTHTRDPTTKPEPALNLVSGEDLPPPLNPLGPRNTTGS